MSAVVVVIPILARAGGMAEMLRPLAGPSSFQRTVQSALTDLPGTPIVVTSDDPEAAAAAAAIGAPQVTVHQRTVDDYALAVSAVAATYGADIVAVLEPTHPFRPRGLIARTVENLRARDHLDSVVCVRRFSANLWRARADGAIDALAAGGATSETYYQEMVGLALATRPAVLAAGRRLGDAVGFELVDQLWGLVDIRDAGTSAVAAALADHVAQFEEAVDE